MAEIPEPGQVRASRTLLPEVLAIEQKILPADHPSTRITIQNYASLLRRTNREEKAVALEARMKTK